MIVREKAFNSKRFDLPKFMNRSFYIRSTRLNREIAGYGIYRITDSGYDCASPNNQQYVRALPPPKWLPIQYGHPFHEPLSDFWAHCNVPVHLSVHVWK
jgi:hypothetical protein